MIVTRFENGKFFLDALPLPRYLDATQSVLTCSKAKMQTPEQCVKSIQS